MITNFKHFLESHNINDISDIINIAKDEGLTIKTVKRLNSSQLYTIDIYNNIGIECKEFIDIVKNMVDRLIQLGFADSVIFLDDEKINGFTKLVTLEKPNYLDNNLHSLLHFNVSIAKIFLIKGSVWSKN